MRRALVDALIAEQGGLCAYCNARITTEQGRHHVEHLLPRRLATPTAQLTTEQAAAIDRCGSPRDRLDIDYRNLLACCPNKDPKAGTPGPGCGDHKRDRLIALTPLESRCEDAFRYLLTGAIESDLEEGKQVIHVVGLDRRDLERSRRATHVEAMLPPKERGLHLARLLDSDPLPEFIVAAEQLLRTIAALDGSA